MLWTVRPNVQYSKAINRVPTICQALLHIWNIYMFIYYTLFIYYIYVYNTSLVKQKLAMYYVLKYIFSF